MNKIAYSNYVGRIAYACGLCQEEAAKKIDTLTPTQILILDYLLTLSNGCPNLFPNQTTLGKKAGVTRRQSNRVIKQLYEMGFIFKITRPNLACVYFVADIFLLPTFRQRFSKKFTAFKWLSLVMLFSAVFQANVSGNTSAVLFLNSESEKTMDISSVSICKRDKRSLVKMYSSSERSKLILEISKEFNLNRLGQIKLSPYPLQALQYAHEKFKDLKDPKRLRSVFHFFVSVCNDWCESNNVPVDWKTSFDLMEQHSLARDGNVYADQTQDFKKQEVPTQKPTGNYQSSPLPKREYPKQSFSAKPTYSNQSGRAFDRYAEQQRTDEAINESKERLERKIQAAYNAGDTEEVAHLRRYDPDHIDWKKPQVYGAAKSFAGTYPEHIKKELIQHRDSNPNHAVHKYPPVLAMLKEYEESQKPSAPIANLRDENLAKNPALAIPTEVHTPLHLGILTEPSSPSPFNVFVIGCDPQTIPTEEPRPFGNYEEDQNANEDQI